MEKVLVWGLVVMRQMFSYARFVGSLDKQDRDKWIEYINSFQKSLNGLPKNSFIDKEVVNFYTSFTNKVGIKNILKFILNLLNIKKVSTNKQKYIEAIRAESKQAIATLYEVGYENEKKYLNFPRTEIEINTFLDDLNWDTPWTAGAQFSAICVFSATQLVNKEKEENIKNLYSYLNKIVL